MGPRQRLVCAVASLQNPVTASRTGIQRWSNMQLEDKDLTGAGSAAQPDEPSCLSFDLRSHREREFSHLCVEIRPERELIEARSRCSGCLRSRALRDRLALLA